MNPRPCKVCKDPTLCERHGVFRPSMGVRSVPTCELEKNPAAALLYRMLLRLADHIGVDVSQLMDDAPWGRGPKPLRDFFQFDGWANEEPGDPITVPDGDGDVLFSGRVREPQNSDTTVRIFVKVGAEVGDVLRIIRKMTERLDETMAFLTHPALPPF